MWELICKKAKTNYLSLNANERIWYSTQTIISHIENGGIISIYYNQAADNIKDIIEDLQHLNASDIADLLLKMNKLFPNQSIKNVESRNEIIDAWPDGQYDPLIDELNRKYDTYSENLVFKLNYFIKEHISK